MAVTFEQAKFLVEKLAVPGGRAAVKVFRRHGVRRVNVLANTEQQHYAFNQFQFQLLPRCYRPPTGTYSGKAMS